MIRVFIITSNRYWYCAIGITINRPSNMCSALFILAMTFDRFHSIIRPHKAASFNKVKRAKITILCIVLFSMTYNCPHTFINADQGGQCVPYRGVLRNPVLKAWLAKLCCPICVIVRRSLAVHCSVTPFVIRQPIQRPHLLERVYKPMRTLH